MEKIGQAIENCKSCGAKVGPTKELRIIVRQKRTGDTLATIWYAPPLCHQCGGEGSLSLDVEWVDR